MVLGLVLILLVGVFLVEFSNVQRFVNDLRNWLDFSAELLFNSVEREPVVVGDQVDGDTKVAETSRSSDPVKVGLRHLWKVKVYYHVHSLYINTSSEKI